MVGATRTAHTNADASAAKTRDMRSVAAGGRRVVTFAWDARAVKVSLRLPRRAITIPSDDVAF